MDILGFKKTISEIKNSLNKFHRRMGKEESRINELKAQLISNTIQGEKKMKKTEQSKKDT